VIAVQLNEDDGSASVAIRSNPRFAWALKCYFSTFFSFKRSSMLLYPMLGIRVGISKNAMRVLFGCSRRGELEWKSLKFLVITSKGRSSISATFTETLSIHELFLFFLSNAYHLSVIA